MPTEIIKDDSNSIVSGVNTTPQLFDLADNLLLAIIKKPQINTVAKEQSVEAQATNQQPDGTQVSNQEIDQPVDITTARSLKDISPHHSSCIQSKKYSIMGLGFVSEGDDAQQKKLDSTTPVDQVQQQMSNLLTGEAYVKTKVDENLDPLTMFGFAFELYRAIEDFLDAGTGYLEVVRDSGNKIVGINWLPYEDVYALIVKDDAGRARLVYKYSGGLWAAANRYYSLFGIDNRKWVFDHFYDSNASTPTTTDGSKSSTVTATAKIEDVSEVIPFMMPSNQARYYGYPDWLSASTIVTLLSRALQYKSDFYVNKGVLAYILSVIGQIDTEVWNDIKKRIQGSVGGGNNFRNMAINIKNNEGSVQVDKLASTDKTEDQFAKDSEVFATHIVSAHSVPAVLANILIPGKLGAANETVQAIIMFQLLRIGPMQRMVQDTLANTLGNSKNGGIAGLTPEDFRLRKITSQVNMQGLDTAARMRGEAPAAKNPDGTPRDMSQGLKQ
jgi:capsid portal protein